ncbi:Crp/Fnr family transcriptional regulator [Tunicatimonas pelagia]|uniref:Crp/Fnr family transcriptional regulator n=1 Tax=Tunicatimonas pelagia TaxID=931531 RepID=UPI002666E996|nr:Crp/Fnr family transcriptional regulator [Tunicatimonas pelagia]WKN45025.1 Crp/Fnr family transcriptional regulator [Tunicatimonas pelagia]
MAEQHILQKILKNDNLTAEELASVVSQFAQVTFNKNEYILQAGEVAHYYYFVESGFVRSYAVDTDGNDITTGFFTKAQILIDWPSFFLKNPTKEHYQALTDCVVWRLGFDEFQRLFHSIEAFREGGRSRLVGSYFALKRRSTAMITDSAKERYLQLVKESPELIHNVSLKHIATYLGITDTSLSRIRKEIAKE